MNFSSDFFKSKTTWLGFGYILFNIGDGIIHSRSVSEVISHVFAALATIFVRDTVAKLGEAEIVFHLPDEAKFPGTESPHV